MSTSKMDTTKMLHFKPADAQASNEAYIDSAQLFKLAKGVYETSDGVFIRAQIKEVVEKNYDLGEVTEVYEIFGGYVNRSFGVICVKDGKTEVYFVRKYKAKFNAEANPDDILYEHNLINYCLKNGLKEAAKVYESKNGTTMVSLIDKDENGKDLKRYFAVYDYLEGEDRYTWVNNENTPVEFRNLGALQARFHFFGLGFNPGDLAKAEPPIQFLLPAFVELFSQLASRYLPDSIFHATFNSKLSGIIDCVKKNQIPAEAFAQMPQTPIHSDLHAGNVKWQGDNCTGIFDFDWSKIDVRLFDICFALIYCCSSWRPETDGILRIDDCRYFLEGYNNQLKSFEKGLAPLNDTERKYFPLMMGAACQYLINWCTTLYFYEDPEKVNDYEALYYLLHITRLMEWIEIHKADLSAIMDNI
ncbi:MAG: phosphotransferase [Deltaproteobacteria bacterium]|jgi:homoserine kinase type II|nr:phosphotransferase [Deltaproteobacteria bacterium]